MRTAFDCNHLKSSKNKICYKLTCKQHYIVRLAYIIELGLRLGTHHYTVLNIFVFYAQRQSLGVKTCGHIHTINITTTGSSSSNTTTIIVINIIVAALLSDHFVPGYGPVRPTTQRRWENRTEMVTCTRIPYTTRARAHQQNARRFSPFCSPITQLETAHRGCIITIMYIYLLTYKYTCARTCLQYVIRGRARQ